MKQASANQPVIFLCEKTAGSHRLKKWLEESRFLTSEAADIFQVLEEISDFTVSCSPDVILLEVRSLNEDFSAVREAVQNLSGKDNLPIFALSDKEKNINCDGCFQGDFTKLTAELNRIIPERVLTHTAA